MNDLSQEHFASALADLKTTIAARAHDIERARNIPGDVFAQMRSAGIFRMFLPKAYGGLELDLPAIIDVMRELARCDGSAGWITMIGAGSVLFSTMLPRETFDRIYRSDPDAFVAGTTQLLGTIARHEGQWRAHGQWPFASGCRHATWMLGFCRFVPDGWQEGDRPQVRVVLLPADRWTILDTWHVPGLKGTGSDDISLDTFIDPHADLFDLSQPVRWATEPLYAGVPQMIALMHASISVGIAEGALDDLLAIAASGRRQERATAPMRDTEAFQRDLGAVHADIRAAKAVLTQQTQSHWQHAIDGTLGTDAKLVEGSQTAIWTVATCRNAVDKCFALAGSTALYERSPLQRRLRDIHVAAQHNLMQPRHYQKAGRLLVDHGN